MNLEVLYTPSVTNNDLYTCRFIGVSYPCIFSLKSIPEEITATGFRYADGVLFLEVDAATSSLLSVNDLIKLDLAGTLVNSRIISIEADPSAPTTYLIETTYIAGDSPTLTFYVTSSADTVVYLIIKAEGKPEFKINSRLDIDGVVTFDAAPVLEQYLRVDDEFNYIDTTFKEPNATIDFTVKYQVVINGDSLEPVPLQGIYTASLAANQNLNENDSNLLEYIPTGGLPLAKFLNSEEGKLPAWNGYPFWLDAYFADAILNPEVNVAGATVAVPLTGSGLYRINGNQTWLAGGGEVCVETTGTGDGIEPPPIKESFSLVGYHFRGTAEAKTDLAPIDPITPASCGQNYLADSKRFKFGYHAVDTIHEGFTLAPNEFIIFGLDASGGENGFLKAWQFIAKYSANNWVKVATSAKRGGMVQSFVGTPLEAFNNSTFEHDGFIDMSTTPEQGNNLTDLNSDLTAAGLPTISAGTFASVKQFIYYQNTSSTAELIRLYQVIQPPSIKTEKLTVFAKRICP